MKKVLIDRKQMLKKMQDASAETIAKLIFELDMPSAVTMIAPIIAVEIITATLNSIFGEEDKNDEV